MPQLPDLLNVTLKGPFWSANADVIKLADPRENWAFRTLFVDTTPRAALGTQALLLPGTMLFLCFVKRVQIKPVSGDRPAYIWQRDTSAQTPKTPSLDQISSLLKSGQLALLLVQADADPSNWRRQNKDALPEFTCLAGDIYLVDGLKPAQTQSLSDAQRLYKALKLEPATLADRSGAARLLAPISVHSSGLSIYGKTTLPWRPTESISACFQLARLLPDPVEGQLDFRLTIETDRLIPEEKDRLLRFWQQLSQYLNPQSPLNGTSPDASTPAWVTLELANALRIPRLYWQVSPWQEAPANLPLFFERDEINLLLSDQPPNSTQTPPTSLARIVPDVIAIAQRPDNRLQISVEVGQPAGRLQDSLTYAASQTGTAWTESVTLKNLEVAFNPVQTPQVLRNQQNLPIPEWVAPTAIEPAVLWGFMPLEDGWAQLPILNLTDQMYLDADLALSADQPLAQSTKVFQQGAVSFGNDSAPVLTAHPFEQPWSVTLTDAHSLKGVWELEPQNDGFRLARITLDAAGPEVILNGFFWLSTGQPTAADALPNLDNWMSSLESMPLSTVRPDRDLFPPAVTLLFDRLAFAVRRNGAASALLQGWSFTYQTDAQRSQSIFRRLIEKGVLPKDTFSRHLPLIWRRHTSLPMIQALPLIQSQSPPNYPSPNRQLAPFELVTQEQDGIALPSPEWRFGIATGNGAATWCRVLSQPQPAQEWRSRFNLPLAALSLPGVVLDPKAGVLDLEPTNQATTSLPIQYRFDLPYTDEINALAQLPKILRPANEVSPLPDSPPPEPPKPLTRETFAEHWQRLSDRANLASADATAAIVKQNNQTVIRHLVEPLDWSVRLTPSLEQYPGSITLENGDGQPAPLQLSKDSALKGISGNFTAAAGTLSRLSNGVTAGAFRLEAGSMLAHRDSQGALWDQRGLVRSATRQQATLLKTPVRLYDDEAGYELTSALVPIDLQVTGDRWQFWFRDLPVRANQFSRTLTRSQPATAIDVNDPSALSRDFNYLSGYEWRLGGPQQTDFLPLFNLHFYPLTLEAVQVNGDRVTQVELVGRLQLPLPNGGELETLSNAVRLTFAAAAGTQSLQLTAIALESEVGEWFLAMSQVSEASEAPLLQWRSVRLTPDKDGIVIDQIALKFFQFGAAWSVPLNSITFQQPKARKTQIHPFPQATPSSSLAAKTLELTIDLASDSFTHTVDLTLAVQLGAQAARSIFAADVRFALLGPTAGQVACTPPAVERVPTLFDDLQLLSAASADKPSVLFTGNALQFQWQTYELSDGSNLQLLPGMHLQSNQAPGFVALTFEVAASTTGIPQLQLKTAFIEALLFCQWGDFLQQRQTPQSAMHSHVYSSSAGDLIFGYTAEWQASNRQWQESLLLNGVLEVKNLISWSTEMAFDQAQATLTLPAVRSSGTQPLLPHIRHTMRILFNQCAIPSDLLVVGQNQLLFNLASAQAWQFLAIVEHQLIRVSPTPDLDSQSLEREHRWTALQEVRLFSPPTFKQFLRDIDAKQTLDPVSGTDEIEAVSDGYLKATLRSLLAEGNQAALDQLPADTLLVEASAPHWIRQTPVAAASPTTLQFLPNGSQHAILSSPQDYGPSDPQNPQWLLLTMPFLGRLQERSRDQTQNPPANSPLPSALQVDPILTIHRHRTAKPADALPVLALALTNSGDTAPVKVKVSSLDTVLGRTWARLDPLSLEENWFRLQHPLSEAQTDGIQSVMVNVTDTPARLSRAVALQRAFDPNRQFYPPHSLAQEAEPAASPHQIVWQDDSFLVAEAVSTRQFSSSGLQVLYTFEDDSTSPVIQDVSGVGTPLNLRIRSTAGISRSTPGVLSVSAPTLIASECPATKIIDACKASNELTIEVWVKPAKVDQGNPSRIVTLSQAFNSRNVALQQGVWNNQPERAQGTNQKVYGVRLRTKNTNDEGDPALMATGRTPTTELVHLVYTRDRSGAARLYINGTAQASGTVSGDFSNWANSPLALANELDANLNNPNSNTNRAWLGDYHLVAIYSRALTAAEVQQNFNNRTHTKAFRKLTGWPITGLQLLGSRLLEPQPTSRLPQRHAAATQLPALLRQKFSLDLTFQADLNANKFSDALRRAFTQNGVTLALSKVAVTKKAEGQWLIVDTLNRQTYTVARTGQQLIVAWTTPAPMSFAVSPYLGLEFRPAPTQQHLKLRLLSAELLCLDPTTATLLPAASRFWELQEQTEAAVRTQSLDWARETHRRLCQTSPVAIVRFREINQNTDTATQIEVPLITTYSFALVTDLFQAPSLVKRVFALRSTVKTLRFQEGQFGGRQLPAHLQAFEVAPPQTTGVQPMYLTARPNAQTPDSWPWGLSALRLSVQYSQNQVAAIGHLGNGSTQGDALTLWWQAPQQSVQYQAAGNGSNGAAPTAGLPPVFRAPAIKSLLPVLPKPPLPELVVGELVNSNDRAAAIPDPVLLTKLQRWQPVLPGGFHYWMVGSRPGAMMAVRNQLLRQRLSVDADQAQVGDVVVSGSIPVQHRTPRPVPLPKNTNVEQALQPWSSYFEPTQTQRVSQSPADEAFFAESGAVPARRLRMQLQQPLHGAIPAQWDGELVFELTSDGKPLTDWEIRITIVDGNQMFTYSPPPLLEATTGFVPIDLSQLQTHLSRSSIAHVLTVTAQVKSKSAQNGFFQTLSFPLRISSDARLRLPLEPHFIQFEDPEYNRRLASTPVHASGILQVQEQSKLVMHTVTLSADRREYNPSSQIALRYDWDDDRPTDAADDRPIGTATLELQRIVNGVLTPLTLNSSDRTLAPKVLKPLSLTEIQRNSNVQLQAGDTLQFKLTITVGSSTVSVFLQVTIVDTPVTPVPEAAYALLRHQVLNGKPQVECVRFAWSPEATRVELVCPEDLRTDVVRRRAVFHWQDSVRSGTVRAYAIQKITQTGATYFPDLGTV